MQLTSHRTLSAFVISLAAFTLSFSSSAQDLEPRSYTNVPIGLNFVALGYAHSSGELSPSPNAPIEDAELSLDAGALVFARTFDLLGKSSKVDVGAARICIEGSAIFKGDYVEGRRCGYSDAKMRLTWNFLGAPALTPKEYGSWDPGFVMGTSVQISAPTGRYDSDKLINLGANRWMIRPGIGISDKFGDWHYDVLASVRIFETNNNYYNGNKLEQDPLYSLQGHVIYNFSLGHWISLNLNYFRGGETKQNGVKSDNEQSNSRFGVTYSVAITRQQSLKLYANTGVVTRIGNDFDTFGAAWLYRF